MTPYALLPDRPLASLGEYRAHQGGSLLGRIRDRDPEAVIAALAASGLRGRGGGGFPAGTKWRNLRTHPCPTKFVVANAAEGEPGTFKDRWLLRTNPYAVLEGALLAAHVLGTELVYLATKKAYRTEIARLTDAVHELAGEDLLEGVEFELVEGPDEYLFGEEKALLSVIEGTGPFPREAHYPPYEWGIEATAASPNPTLVQNVETLARAATVGVHGPVGFAEAGDEDTAGWLLVTLSGAIRRPGIYEVEAGRPLRDVLQAEGGGAPDGTRWIGALPGVAHPVLMEPDFDTPLSHAAFREVGSGLGSAGFILLDDRASLPRVARAVARFLAVESCGQCHACKLGLTTAHEELEALPLETGTDRDHLRRIEEWARSAPNGNRCNLPFQGSQILPSLMEDFPNAFLAPEVPGARGFLLPKFLDFDPAARAFTLDRKHLRKQLDWSHEVAMPRGTQDGAGGGKAKGDSGGVESDGLEDDEHFDV